VAYTALDREFAEPVFADFSAAAKVTVLPKFDVESTKTVGLAEALIAERARPRCDVFWNNEILQTLRLEKLGLLAEYRPPNALLYPAEFRSPRGTWCGFAARARVLLVNTNLVAETDRPTSILDLKSPTWRGKVAIAKPLFGTTATQAACLFAVWGDEAAEEFFRSVKGNAQVLSGNKQVAQAVASGQVAFGLTDTDDAIVEVERGESVAIVYPDQGEGQLGTLFIPNTISILKDCPHPEAARQLVDFVLSPAVEDQLAKGPSAQITLGSHATATVRVETPRTVRAMQVDFDAALEKWPTAAAFLRDTFTVD
jgi:iron(III) transport system substrate-binding protein